MIIRDIDAFIAEMTTEIDRWESGDDAANWRADGSHERTESFLGFSTEHGPLPGYLATLYYSNAIEQAP